MADEEKQQKSCGFCVCSSLKICYYISLFDTVLVRQRSVG